MRVEKDKLEALVVEANEALDQEPEKFRPINNYGKPGGIINLHPEIPTFIIPDLHGRHEFLSTLLDYEWRGDSVIQHLSQGTIQVVCVGDGMHAEARSATRWRSAYLEYQAKFVSCPAMDQEMEENFETMSLVMKLKVRFPQHFHFLKGNHENILNENENGNHAFGKFVLEGEMVTEYVRQFYGEEFLFLYSQFEKKLPFLAIGQNFIISHAQPKRKYSYQEILDSHALPEVAEGLTWTSNQVTPPGTVPEMLQEFLPVEGNDIYWFAGHRPIPELYRLWEEESFIQLHNPRRQGVTILDPGVPFDPEQHIFEL